MSQQKSDSAVTAGTVSGLARKATRNINRAEIVDQNFIHFLENWKRSDSRDLILPAEISEDDLKQLLHFQMQSRQVDLVAREMRARNEGFYTIGSSGHENNSVVGHLTRKTDPAFLHYRSGGFMMATIASHLPKAMGTAVALEQAKRLRLDLPIPSDSIAVCSFGDASSNHATAQTAFNAAQWTAFQGLPVPVLYICEDNGLGISVHTPNGWVEANFRDRQGMDYFQAGTDMEAEYRGIEAVEKTEANDPLLLTAKTVLDAGLMKAAEIYANYQSIRNKMRSAAMHAAKAPKLSSSGEVMQPQEPYDEAAVKAEVLRKVDQYKRLDFFGQGDLMLKYPMMSLFGEDVAQKGGVYTVTSGLVKRFSGRRVFNTLLDETTILAWRKVRLIWAYCPCRKYNILLIYITLSIKSEAKHVLCNTSRIINITMAW